MKTPNSGALLCGAQCQDEHRHVQDGPAEAPQGKHEDDWHMARSITTWLKDEANFPVLSRLVSAPVPLGLIGSLNWVWVWGLRDCGQGLTIRFLSREYKL